MREQGRLLHSNWDLYDTRHTVFRSARMSPEQLEEGYWRAYRDFYRWGAIARGALVKETWPARARHFAYAAGWKKFEPLWDLVLRARRVAYMRPVLERVLLGYERRPERRRLDWVTRSNVAHQPQGTLAVDPADLLGAWESRFSSSDWMVGKTGS
jgi:hypothetical protein